MAGPRPKKQPTKPTRRGRTPVAPAEAPRDDDAARA